MPASGPEGRLPCISQAWGGYCRRRSMRLRADSLEVPVKKALGGPYPMRWMLIIIGVAMVAAVGCRHTEPQAETTPGAEQPRLAQERRDQPVTNEDLLILQRAAEILNDEALWDREDDRICEEADTTWSLFCALQKASIEFLGEYQHRRVSLQEVRFAIEDVSGGEAYAHRLMDFNNTRSYEDVLRVLEIATERVASRLQDH